ncbi:uncharacterized protein LOC130648998 isoform X1 [Hydractinia symbiolongicarpus]|uniref:uncharacterized protein LOC130648998 isoform X1 n=1 Tax=Hydractinia symbiolongicarpus TaxID=13093 RepID=UPI00254C7FFA|nr:uncharacterized protein LOC130648998 isoform X1 [Hydractinia symbiolongicarpus]XP_057311154.1 uncharacterized protein LOC130648998 isoform X1 [Hydractinia symbiolongicarpus]
MPEPAFHTRNVEPIGSFRDSTDVKKFLPGNLYEALYSDISDNLDIHDLIKVVSNSAYLNNAAFGRAYSDVYKLSMLLREFSETSSDVFYDQVCLPLVKHSYEVAEAFFRTENVLLVQNCTFGMKSVADLLIKEKQHERIACLDPLYGATKKLLSFYEENDDITNLIPVSPGENPLFEEDPNIILSTLEEAYSECDFTVLFCDEVSSQSGRVLPLKAIAKFCKTNNIVLVVDGTQSCELFFGDNVDVLKEVDYFVMSTHKWIGNVKTCGVVLYKTEAPSPPVISFGWEPRNAKLGTTEKVRSAFLWQGMMDSYLSYITLSKALKIFKKYGEKQFRYASNLLQKNISGFFSPLLPNTRDRVINVVTLENAQLEPIQGINKIQNTLQDYGVFVSVKEISQDCSTKKSFGQKGRSCTRPSGQTIYLRLSCWSYNDQEDFNSLKMMTNNNLELSKCSREAVRHQFLFMFDLYEKLFSVLELEAYFIRAEPLRHHLIFYYGHTAVFYINKLLVSGNISRFDRIDSEMESSFSVGVDEMSWDDILEDNYEWTGFNRAEKILYLEKVKNYREKVKELVLELIDANPITSPVEPGSLYWILLMGMEHEKIHMETSAVIISQVPLNLIKNKHTFNYQTYWNSKKSNAEALGMPDTNKLVPIPSGTVLLGKTNLEQDLYGWDNEYGHEEKHLESFQASQMLVSNAEYLQFVEAGGYTEKKWWSQEGWKFVNDMKVSEPRFWRNKKRYRAMLEEIPMPWNLPVEVNNLEAQAFCKWKGAQLGKKLRLISHDESFHMRQIVQNESSNTNLNKYASPTPVNMYGGEIDGVKVYDVSGNVWRHSVSILTVLKGFRIDPFYNDFTLPTIDGFHNHILGGSWISMGNCANVNARYGFRRHFYQYAGIRYVCSENTYHERVLNMFDQNELTMKISEHYSDFTEKLLVEKQPIENWPKLLGQTSVQLINEHVKNVDKKQSKLLVSFGGPGRSTLEILRGCQNLFIDHTDNSANDLQVLKSLLDDTRIQWYQQLEGFIVKPMEYHLTETSESLLAEKNNTVNYMQADYNNMRSQLDNYDVIVADFRHKDGGAELLQLINRLRRGGLLILGSIDDLLSEDSCKNKNHSMSVLKTHCSPFMKNNVTEYAHVYYETRNKHQYFISQLSVWVKKLDQDNEVSLQVESKKVAVDEEFTTEKYYEDGDILASYKRFHFGPGLLSVENFPLQMAKVCVDACRKHQINFNTALDAGCGPGRTAIELCQHFKQVMAYDYSQGFVDLMQKSKADKKLANLSARQGDSHKQVEMYADQKFDLIVGCNLIDRLHSPKDWVLQSKAMLSSKGLLVIASPYTWKSEHTNVENWIGGFKKDGEDFYTIEGLRDLLLPDLVLLEETKVPFVIPDADGTFQYTYSNCAIFGRR